MKRQALVSLVSLLSVVTGGAEAATPPTPDRAIINDIRQQYAAINRREPRYRVVRRDVMGRSTEGGEAHAYFAGASLRKLVTRFYGCSGRWHTEYYFRGGRLIFAHQVNLTYKDIGSWAVTGRRDTRFYFRDGRLVRLMASHADNAPANRDEALRMAHDEVAEAREYLELLTQSATVEPRHRQRDSPALRHHQPA